MATRFFSPYGFGQDGGLAVIRILTGLFMIYHGWEIFDTAKMNEYAKWLTDLGFPSSSFVAYLGKGAELISGVFLTLGLLTRIGGLMLVAVMAGICFGMGKGRIFMEDQHPFLFVLLAFVFFFAGPGRWSLDNAIFNHSEKR